MDKFWGLTLDPSRFAHCRSYSEIVAGIYEEWARKEKKRRWGDKTPQYVTEIPTLLEIFPGCKIIHIIRDGRDVALSWLNVNFGPENVFTAASDWKYFVSAGREFGKALLPETYLEVRYEEILVRPRDVLECVSAFLGETFHDETLKPNSLERGFRDPVLGARSPKYVSRTEIVGENSEKWKEKMSRSDRITFESVAGDLLESLGYETEGVTRNITKPERFFWKAHNSFLWFLSRLDASDKRKWIKTDLLLRWADIRRRYGSKGRV